MQNRQELEDAMDKAQAEWQRQARNGHNSSAAFKRFRQAEDALFEFVHQFELDRNVNG